MIFSFNVKTNYSKTSGVQVEWKCRGHHEGCDGTHWQPHSQIPADDALKVVESWNRNQPWFNYRLKP